VFLAGGDEKTAFEYLLQAVPYVSIASHQPVFRNEEGVACAAILQIVAEKLGDSKRLAIATGYLGAFPPERVRAMQNVFQLPKRK
jgi:hypothetical protein